MAKLSKMLKKEKKLDIIKSTVCKIIKERKRILKQDAQPISCTWIWIVWVIGQSVYICQFVKQTLCQSLITFLNKKPVLYNGSRRAVYADKKAGRIPPRIWRNHWRKFHTISYF